LIKSLESGDLAMVEALLDDDRSRAVIPRHMALIHEKFPGLRRRDLVDWFYAQKGDPMGRAEGTAYFLTIVTNARAHDLLGEILTDERLPALPFFAAT
jgi:hypothetical protein